MKSDEPVFHLLDAPATLHERLAARVAIDLSEAIATKGYASLMLSGGNTPKPFLSQLASEPVEWEKVRIGLVDERWVPEEDPASNASLVRMHLLDAGAQAAQFFGMYREGVEADAAIVSVETQLRERLYPFDVVVLGMGNDGHTASLFPHNPMLLQGLDLRNESLLVVMQPADAPHLRMSLTLGAILSATHCYLHIEGPQKLAVYREALAEEDVQEMPIRAVLQHKAVEVYYS